MKTENTVQIKSYTFSVRIIRLYQFLVTDKKEYVLSKQILRCGTSIGANIEEAIGGQSKRDFYAKLSIAYKEARETHYWIRLLSDTGYLDEKMKISLLNDVEELLRIIGSIRKSITINSQ